MVKVGFLVEGDTEKVIIQSEAFEQFCKNIGIEIIRSVFPPHKKERGKDVFKNAEKIKSYLDILKDMGADYVCCLRDLEDLPCITSAKNEISTEQKNVLKIIAVKQIESWFLADQRVLQKYFGESFTIQFPEANFPELIFKADEKLNEISRTTRNGKGIGDKLLFAKSLIRNGFSIQNAASHPNCPSANYFLTKLEQLSPQ